MKTMLSVPAYAQNSRQAVNTVNQLQDLKKVIVES